MSSETPFGRSIRSTKEGMGINSDILISERFIGGPKSGKDVRMYIGKEALMHMLSVARMSGTGRAVLKNVGIRVSEWREPGGNVYEVWGFFSGDPETEEGTPLSRLASIKTRTGY
jgi:hypothetical protein